MIQDSFHPNQQQQVQDISSDGDDRSASIDEDYYPQQ